MSDEVNEGAAQRRRAQAWAEGLAAASGLDIHVAVTEEEAEAMTLAFEGADAKYLVGRGGSCLDAIQYLFSLGQPRQRSGPRLRVLFDADGYRARREKTLQELAQELAEQVRRTGNEAVLDPLSPLERRIVHTALQSEPGIRTYSEGEEPERFVIISPAEDGDAEDANGE